MEIIRRRNQTTFPGEGSAPLPEKRLLYTKTAFQPQGQLSRTQRYNREKMNCQTHHKGDDCIIFVLV